MTLFVEIPRHLVYELNTLLLHQRASVPGLAHSLALQETSCFSIRAGRNRNCCYGYVLQPTQLKV